jgi:competence protein ComEC
LRQLAGETIAAQIATAPLLLYAFGQISNVAIIANLAVLPLVPLAMLLTFLTGLTSYLVPFLAEIIAMPTQLLLDYMVWVTKQTAGLDWAISAWPLPFVGLVASYVILIAFCWWMKRASKYSLRQSNIID